MDKRKVIHQFLAVLSVAALLLCLSCGEKSANPVESDISLLASAAINGEVLSSCTGSVSGINVSIIGTDLTAVTDTQGLFNFQGIPLGNQQLLFAQGAYQGSLVINDIKPSEQINVHVHCYTYTVTVQNMERTQGTSFQGEITAIDSTSNSIDVAGTDQAIFIDDSSTEFKGDIQIFGELYVGLEVEGKAVETADNGLVATKIEAEFPEAEFKGTIEAINAGTSSFTVSGFGDGIFTDDSTIMYKGEVTCFFDDLEVGQEVKGEGVYKGIGNIKHFVATTIEVETEEEELGELRAEIKPDHWNLNWQGSSGQFSVEIRGEGYSEVDTASSIVLQRDSGEMLESQRVKLSGNHVRAFFAKKDAFSILADPSRGDSYEIIITGTFLDGTTFELTDTIYVLGSPKE